MKIKIIEFKKDIPKKQKIEYILYFCDYFNFINENIAIIDFKYHKYIQNRTKIESILNRKIYFLSIKNDDILKIIENKNDIKFIHTNFKNSYGRNVDKNLVEKYNNRLNNRKFKNLLDDMNKSGLIFSECKFKTEDNSQQITIMISSYGNIVTDNNISIFDKRLQQIIKFIIYQKYNH